MRLPADLWICLLLLAAIFGVYAQSRQFAFVNYDDPDYVTANPHVRQGITADGALWALTSTEAANWFPVTRLSHMLDVQLFGMDAGWHHLVSVLIHAAASVLLFLLLMRATGARAPSAFVAFVFALHPLHVESVAWVAERKDVLSTFFEMAALLLYVRLVERRTVTRYLAMAGMFALGLMAKPMLVTFPFILLLLDYWPLRRLNWPPRWAPAKPLLLEKTPLLALSAIGSVLTFFAQRGNGMAALDRLPVIMRLGNAVLSYVAYIGKAVWPADLGVLYPLTAPAAVPAALAALILLAITAAAFRAAKSRPYLLTGWLWYIGTLVPVIGLVQVGSQSRADRYMYVPLVGLSIAAVWAAADWAEERPRLQRALAAAAGLLLLLAAAGAHRQAGYWRDSTTLFEHTLAVTEQNHLIHANLGTVLQAEGKLEAAAAEYRQAVTIYPEYAEGHEDLGTVLAAEGNFEAAAAEYRRAATLNPGNADAHANLGHELLRAGQFDQASDQLREAIRLKPGIPAAQGDFGILLASRGDYQEAARHLTESLRQAPGDAAHESNLCFVLLHAGQPGEAMAHCKEALRLQPDLTDAHFNLGSVLAALGQKSDARTEFALALRSDPANAAARKALEETGGK
jgi:tetratricopeptide (TPR) repeat protein